MIRKKFSMPMVVAVATLVSSPAFAEVTFEWATVGNPGNAADPLNSPGGPCEPDCIPGIGTVGYVYRIAKHEVTNDQYAEFLNAVAATDANGLYSSFMGSNARGGITQSGSSGSFTYAVKTDMGNKPVNYVSFFDAMRFVNWLQNNQSTGAQNKGTTEAGVYTIDDGLSETRAAAAQFFIPTENEWYKAAYHQPSGDGGDDDDYWLYPTASNVLPTEATATPTGDIDNPGMNVANYNQGADWNSLNGNVTTVGSAGAMSDSFYATSDQGGNVFEWNETVLSASLRVVRGGSWSTVANGVRSRFQNYGPPAFESSVFGFRVASPPKSTVPTDSEWALAAMALLILTAGTIVHGKRAPRPA